MPRDWSELFITDGPTQASAQAQSGEGGERRGAVQAAARKPLKDTASARVGDPGDALCHARRAHVGTLGGGLDHGDVGASTTAAVVETLERALPRWREQRRGTVRAADRAVGRHRAQRGTGDRDRLRAKADCRFSRSESTAPARRQRSASSPGICARSWGGRAFCWAPRTRSVRPPTEQLEGWARARRLRDRHWGPGGSDPGSVAFEAVAQARAARNRCGDRWTPPGAFIPRRRSDGGAGEGQARDGTASSRGRRTRRC